MSMGIPASFVVLLAFLFACTGMLVVLTIILRKQEEEFRDLTDQSLPDDHPPHVDDRLVSRHL